MERQALLAALLCLLVLIAYQAGVDYFYPPPPPPPPGALATPQVAGTATAEAPAAAAVPPGAPATAPPAPGRLIPVESELYSAEISSTGGRIVSMRLKRYRTTVEEDSGPLEMIEVSREASPPLGVRFQTAGGEALDDTAVVYAADRDALRVAGADEATLTLAGTLPTGARIEKVLTFRGDAYPIAVTVRAPELAATYVRVGLGWRHEDPAAQASGHEAHYRGAMVMAGKNFVHELTHDLAEEGPLPFTSPVGWAGYTEHYFVAAIVPESADEARAVIDSEGGGVEVLVSSPRAEDEGTRFTVYVGPKKVDLLEDVGHGLERAVDFGWFSLLAIPLIRLLNLFHRVTGNYGIDIILLTILVKVLFIPLTHKSMKSMRAMQRLQPQMAKLREKFKDDRERLNKEMIELYRRHRVNPLGGCLPMLLQFPVFIGLYQGLYGAIELRHAGFALWVADLSTNECYPWPGQTTLVGCNDLSILGMPIPVLVLLMGASMILQQYLTPATGMDPTQQRMMMVLMPIMFTVMFVTFPSGLVLYWLVNNVLTIGQQWYINRAQT